MHSGVAAAGRSGICLTTLVRQPVYQIACGYADQNDATTLRTDPLLKLVCGRHPVSGEALASQPTFSRLENAVDRHAVEALAETLVDVYIRERGRGRTHPAHLLLDLDGTNDPAHGEQEGVAVPRLLPAAHVPSAPGLRRRDRPAHHGRSCGPATPTPVASSSWCSSPAPTVPRGLADGHAGDPGR